MIAKGSFEDFLFILIGVIWIGFSIYKAQQKKKAVSQNQVNTKKEKSFFENLMSEFLTEEPANPYKVSHEEPSKLNPLSTKESDTKKIFSYDDYYEESNSKPGFDVFEKTPVTRTEVIEEIKTYTKKRRKPKIDLRKAVIYSEILNRKYN